MKNLIYKIPYLKYLYSVICVLSLSSLVLSCGNSRSAANSTEQRAMIEELVISKNFKIESDVAYPRTTAAMVQIQNAGILNQGDSAGRINLIGNPNELKISGDSVSSQLPYYGEGRAGGHYNPRNVGITLNGSMADYKAEWDEKKNRYEITFNADDEDENYDVLILIYPNKTSSMVLAGSRRLSIEYRGRVSVAE